MTPEQHDQHRAEAQLRLVATYPGAYPSVRLSHEDWRPARISAVDPVPRPEEALDVVDDTPPEDAVEATPWRGLAVAVLAIVALALAALGAISLGESAGWW